MQRLALTTASLLILGAPAFAADLYGGPVYREPRVYIERAPPVVVERRVIEHHHYHYDEPHETYVPPRVYAPYRWSDTWYDGTYGYRGHGYAGRPFGWRRHHHRRW